MRKNITRETTITLLLLPRIINSHTSYKFIPNWQNGNFVNFLYVVLHIICSHSETFKLQCLEKKTDIVVDSTRLKSYVTINSDAFSYINSNQLWLPALNISYVTAHTHACTHARTHAHTHTHTQPFYSPLSGITHLSRYLKKHSPAYTYPHHQPSFISFLHLLWSTVSSLTVLLHNPSLSALWSTSWPSTSHFILLTFLHPNIVFFLQHMPIPTQSVLLWYWDYII